MPVSLVAQSLGGLGFDGVYEGVDGSGSAGVVRKRSVAFVVAEVVAGFVLTREIGSGTGDMMNGLSAAGQLGAQRLTYQQRLSDALCSAPM